MFSKIGFWEILLIVTIALVVFGPKKLPEIGRAVGSSLREFRKATRELSGEFAEAVRDDIAANRSERPAPPQSPAVKDAAEQPSTAATKTADHPPRDPVN